MDEKRPRHYAYDYLNARGVKEKQAIVDSIPAHYKNMVKIHIQNAKDKKSMRLKK